MVSIDMGLVEHVYGAGLFDAVNYIFHSIPMVSEKGISESQYTLLPMVCSSRDSFWTYIFTKDLLALGLLYTFNAGI